MHTESVGTPDVAPHPIYLLFDMGSVSILPKHLYMHYFHKSEVDLWRSQIPPVYLLTFQNTHLTVPEHGTDEFTNVQHLLNMTCAILMANWLKMFERGIALSSISC